MELRGMPLAKSYDRAQVIELKALYSGVKGKIDSRLSEFKRRSEEAIFLELCFCLFTPQSKAKSCWAAVERLRESGLLYSGTPGQIAKEMAGVRFHNNKAGYLVEARGRFVCSGECRVSQMLSGSKDVYEAREWLVKNIKGMSYKEASHFLRNIGRGERLAILDRHILKNMKALGVIDEVPRTLNKKTYLELEQELLKFSDAVGIPPDHLDLLLWYKEAGEVFK